MKENNRWQGKGEEQEEMRGKPEECRKADGRGEMSSEPTEPWLACFDFKTLHRH